MEDWLKTSFASGLVALGLAVVIFVADILKLIFGNINLGIKLFYLICFILLAVFLGTVVGILKKGLKVSSENTGELIALFFNGISFFIILGFGFSIQILKSTQNDLYAWISIFSFFILGTVVMILIIIEEHMRASLN
jgi:hypothetical protein